MPRGQLRRKDREIGAAELEGCLERALVGRIATVGPDGFPYVVPLNFVYDPVGRTVLMHCAATGHLLENLAHDSRACFEVDEPGAVVGTGPDACDTSQLYRSVICFGRARIVSDPQEAAEVLNALVRKYVDQLMPERGYEPRFTTMDATTAIVLNVDIMTGKQRKLG